MQYQEERDTTFICLYKARWLDSILAIPSHKKGLKSSDNQEAFRQGCFQGYGDAMSNAPNPDNLVQKGVSKGIEKGKKRQREEILDRILMLRNSNSLSSSSRGPVHLTSSSATNPVACFRNRNWISINIAFCHIGRAT